MRFRLRASAMDGNEFECGTRVAVRARLHRRYGGRAGSAGGSAGGRGAGIDAGGSFLLLDFLLGKLRLETTAAARFIHSAGADDDQFFRGHDALGVHGGISAAHADGEKLGDFLGNGEQAGHWLERAAQEIGVETGDNNALAELGEAGAVRDDAFTEELGLINAHDFGARGDLFQDVGARADELGRDLQAGVRDDAVLRVALINHRLENLHALPADFGARQGPGPFLALAWKL